MDLGQARQAVGQLVAMQSGMLPTLKNIQAVTLRAQALLATARAPTLKEQSPQVRMARR
jgi:hypothetical protein